VKILNRMWLFLALALVSTAWAGDRGSPRTLDECFADEEFVLTSDLEEFTDFYLDESGEDGGNCGRRPSDDITFQLIVQDAGGYSFDVDGFDETGWIYITTGCCDGDQLYPRGMIAFEDFEEIECMWFEVGTYYLTVEGAGQYELSIWACGFPCEGNRFPEGFTFEGNQIVYTETVNEESNSPNYEGPWEMDGAPCQDESVNEAGSTVGFGYYNWYNQDFGWSHLFDTAELECRDFSIDSAFVVICAYEVDNCYGEGQGDPARESAYCEWDVLFVDDELQLGVLNYNEWIPGNLSVRETRLWVPVLQLEDGRLDLWLDIDAGSDQCAWATEVWSSRLEVYMTCRQLPPTPEGYDLGDLPPLLENEEPCYPTYPVESGGPANAVYPDEDQVAWLGECVNHESFPNLDNVDGCDDGIYFVPSDRPNGSWMPFDDVCIEYYVTTGPAYVQGTPLFLWAWKDGNLDCDFNDTFYSDDSPNAIVASECIIPGYLLFADGPNDVVSGQICFTDPGVLDLGHYDGKLRFRLLSCGGQVPSREGEFVDCLSAQTFVDDMLGETEDYIIADLQLPVELLSFTADGSNGRVVLSWTTATESENEGFEVQRKDGGSWQHAGALVNGAGTSASSHNYQFLDEDVVVGETYQYRLMTVDMHGNRMEVAQTESVVEPSNAVVDKFALHQNFPNPFNPSTQITYDLAAGTNVSLQVFDLLGREVATLVNGAQSAGHYEVNFEAKGLPSGMYFYRLETSQFSDMKKMMLLK
jgi:hypothetical protein